MVDFDVVNTYVGRSVAGDYLNAKMAGLFVDDSYLNTTQMVAIAQAMGAPAPP